MANFTITVPDSVAPRILAAFGHWEVTPSGIVTNNWVSATPAELRAILKQYAQTAVQSYEVGLTSQAKAAEVAVEVW